MNDIINELEKKNLNDTTEKKKWVRNCPKCGKELYYNRKWSKDFCDKNKRLCSICGKTLGDPSEEELNDFDDSLGINKCHF